MRTFILGKLYKLRKHVKINGVRFGGGELVVYIGKDTRYTNTHMFLLPNGQKGSTWSGNLEEI